MYAYCIHFTKIPCKSIAIGGKTYRGTKDVIWMAMSVNERFDGRRSDFTEGSHHIPSCFNTLHGVNDDGSLWCFQENAVGNAKTISKVYPIYNLEWIKNNKDVRQFIIVNIQQFLNNSAQF